MHPRSMQLPRLPSLAEIQQRFTAVVRSGWRVTSGYCVDVHNNTENIIDWSSERHISPYPRRNGKIALTLGTGFGLCIHTAGHLFSDSLSNARWLTTVSFNHTFLKRTENNSEECGFCLMSKEPSEEERKHFNANTIYLYQNAQKQLKYFVKGIPQEHDIGDLKENNNAIQLLFKQKLPEEISDTLDSSQLVAKVLALATTAQHSSEQKPLLDKIFYSSNLEDSSQQAALQVIINMASEKGHIYTGYYQTQYDHNRSIYRQILGSPGFILGAGFGACIYIAGAMGISGFAYHRTMRVVKNSLNEILNMQYPVQAHTDFINQPNMPVAAKVIREINLLRIVNFLVIGVKWCFLGFGLHYKGFSKAYYILRKEYHDLFGDGEFEDDTNVSQYPDWNLGLIVGIATGFIVGTLYFAKGFFLATGLRPEGFSAAGYFLRLLAHKWFDEAAPPTNDKINLWNMGIIVGPIAFCIAAVMGIIALLFRVILPFLGTLGLQLAGFTKDGINKAEYSLRCLYHTLFADPETPFPSDSSDDAIRALSYLNLGILVGAGTACIALGMAAVKIWTLSGLNPNGFTRAEYLIRKHYHNLFTEGGFQQTNEDNRAANVLSNWRLGLVVGIATGFILGGLYFAKGFVYACHIVGFSSYSGHAILRSLKIASNFLFDTTWDIKNEDSVMTATEDCFKKIGILMWLARAVIKSISIIIGLICSPATNYHRFNRFRLNFLNGNKTQDEMLDTREHEDYLNQAHTDNLSLFISRFNFLQLLSIAANVLLYAAWIISAFIFFTLRCAYHVLSYCFGGKTLQPDSEIGNLITHLEQFEYALEPDGTISKPIDPKGRRAQPSLYEDDIHQAYQNIRSTLSKMGQSEKTWRWFLYEVRKSLSLGVLATVEERVLTSFAQAAKKYLEESPRATLGDFFQRSYDKTVGEIKDSYIKKDEKEIVDRLAFAIKFTMFKEIQSVEIPRRPPIPLASEIKRNNADRFLPDHKTVTLSSSSLQDSERPGTVIVSKNIPHNLWVSQTTPVARR